MENNFENAIKEPGNITEQSKVTIQGTERTTCPFCRSTTVQSFIRLPNIEIRICHSCMKASESLSDGVFILTRLKPKSPGTSNEQMLCPFCWRELISNYKTWHKECPDPICGYSQRLPGLSPEQITLRDNYFLLKDKIFNTCSSGGIPTKEDADNLKDLRTIYESFKRYERITK